MVVRVSISSDTIGDAMRTQTVRKALRKLAEKKQARADQIAQAEGVDLESSIKEGTRPRGRPYARVQSSNTAQEWGDRYTERRRILGRAAQS